jgi:hypothetical protein
MASGDSVAAENYLQHAEHYNRIILAAQAQNPGMEQPGGMNGGGRFGQGEAFQPGHDADDEGDADDFVQQPPRFLERPVYNQNQPQPFIPQNAFQHVQPVIPAPAAPANGAAPYPSETFQPSPEAAAPRRRRRRPMGEHQAKGFNGRHSGPGVNGTVAGGDPAPDEAAS